MKKKMFAAVVAGIVIFALFLTTGCLGQQIAERITGEAIEKAIEKGIEEDSGGEVDVDISEGEISIKTDEGEVTFGEGTELPDGFPGVVPVYPDMNIITAWKATEEGKENFSISASTSDTGEKVFDWYKAKMSGWEIESEFSSDMGEDGITFSINGNNGTYNLSILVFESDGETTVVENVGTK